MFLSIFRYKMMEAMAGNPLRDSFATKLSKLLTKNLRISEPVKALNTLSETSCKDYMTAERNNY